MDEWRVPTAAQIFAMRDAAVAAQQQTEELRKRSLLLGYNVQVTSGIMGGSSAGPTVEFRVWRFDQRQTIDDGPSYSSVADVEARLRQLAALPRWCLDLVGNASVRVVAEDEGVFTIITDVRTGKEFVIGTAALEAITVLPIHAEQPPTIGDWYRCDE